MLDGVDLDAEAGELLAILGASGSGKSTLLNVLGLLATPTGGTHTCWGEDVGALSETGRSRLRAHTIGFVFQAFHLVSHLDVRQNVALPLLYTRHPARHRNAVADSALEEVGLTHRATASTATLSGGEKQRAAIARAIVHGPRLLLCDEPTGNLDSANSRAVIALLRRLCRELGITVVVVTHDQSVAQAADRVVHVLDGRVVDHDPGAVDVLG